MTPDLEELATTASSASDDLTRGARWAPVRTCTDRLTFRASGGRHECRSEDHHLTEQQDAWIAAQIDPGRYTDDSEAIRDLIRREQERSGQIERLRQALIEGEQSGDPRAFDVAAFKRYRLFPAVERVGELTSYDLDSPSMKRRFVSTHLVGRNHVCSLNMA